MSWFFIKTFCLISGLKVTLSNVKVSTRQFVRTEIKLYLCMIVNVRLGSKYVSEYNKKFLTKVSKVKVNDFFSTTNFSYHYLADVWLEPSRIYTMELFCKNSSRLCLPSMMVAYFGTLNNNKQMVINDKIIPFPEPGSARVSESNKRLCESHIYLFLSLIWIREKHGKK